METDSIKIIVVDDEPRGRNTLQQLLSQHDDLEVVATAASAEEGIREITARHPDLIFLDIEMPFQTGFDMLELLRPVQFEVVFVTAYDQYAVKAFKYNAIDYVLKPVDFDELDRVLDKVRTRLREKTPPPARQFEEVLHKLRNINNNFDKLALPTSDGLIFIQINDVIRLQSDSNYTLFHLLGNEKILVTRTLGDYEELLREHNFCRVHHSHLINLSHLKRYIKTDGGYALMVDDSKVEISRRKKDEFLAMLDGQFKG
jgi:two-component system LytT family response regulator